jgi:RNA polymerase sigma factor (sigma-70 family)
MQKHKKKEPDSTTTSIEKRILKFKKNKDEKIRNEILSSDEIKKIVAIATAPFLRSGLYDDLTQDAYLGVVKAIDNYKKGGNFFACASIYAKNEIYSRYHEYVCPVKISGLAVRKNKFITSFITEFQDKHGRHPSISEISNGLEIKESRVSAFLNINRGSPISDLPEIPYYDPPNERTQEEVGLMTSKLRILNDVERRVLEESFGISGENQTLEKIAQKLGKTKQRISQIRIAALTKLKKVL